MALVYGSSRTEEIKPEVKLISYSQNAAETVASMWIGSRYNDTISPKNLHLLFEPDTDEVISGSITKQLRKMYPEYSELSGAEIVYKIVDLVDEINLPPLDAVNFVFQIDDATVTFREQLVRSRLPQNFWTQSSRTSDLSTMDISMLDTIRSTGGDKAAQIYKDASEYIRGVYRELIDLGVPQEDIRLAPVNMTHRIYWMVPYRTLKSILRQRISWIAQIGLWGPIVEGVMSQLRSHLDLKPFVKNLSTPLEIKIENGRIVEHKNSIDNEARMMGRDPLPLDPLWVAYRRGMGEYADYPEEFNRAQYREMKKSYAKIWSDEILEILGWDREGIASGPYDPE